MNTFTTRVHHHHLQGAPYKHTLHINGLRFMSSSSINGGASHVHHHPLWYSPYSCCSHAPPSCALSHVPPLKDKDPILLEDPKVEDLMELVSGELGFLEREMSRGDGSHYYVYEALSMVDLIQRLGIARFFEHEIQSILHKTSLEWDEELGLKDKDATVIGFHLLRLHGYSVSSEVLERAKDENGGFFSLSIDSPKDITSLMNLYKCSQVAFPHEFETMQSVEEFAKSQLQKALLECNPSVLSANNLEIEMRFALEYPRRCLLPRLESRSIVRQLWPSNGWRKWCLQLAKIDLEMLQRLHQQEIQLLEEWWEAQGFKEVSFARRIAKKCFLSFAAAIFEPEFSAFRAVFTKSASIAVIIDDLFDLPDSDASLISRFNEAVQRWDASLLDDVREHKVIFTSLCHSTEEMAQEASRLQNRELLPFFKSLWKEYTALIAKWRIDRRVPALDEYLETATVSIGAAVCLGTSAFFLGDSDGEPAISSDAALRAIGKDSRLALLSSRISRLANDVATSDEEAECGELASVVSCYRRREGCSKQQAVRAIQLMIDADCRELEWALFRSAGVAPACYARAVANYARSSLFVYKRGDGFGHANDGANEEMIRDYLCGALSVV